MKILESFWKSRKANVRPDLHVTLWPTFDHFANFANDPRIQGIRLNSAMMEASEIDDAFKLGAGSATVPLWFDIKGMQLRIREVVCDHNHDHLEFILNRPVKAKTPFVVGFKAGEDAAECIEIRNGTHFIFRGGPRYEVRAGESIHIRSPHEVGGPVFLDYEKEKIKKIVDMRFDRIDLDGRPDHISKFYLSYVWDQRHVDEFRELIGSAELRLKIENQSGLDWVASKWRPQADTSLIAARGDLYVELEYPHQVLDACKLIISKDPGATVGSRMLLSVVPPKPKTVEFLQYVERKTGGSCKSQFYDLAEDFSAKILNDANVPRCADLSDLAWLHDIGYRSFLLCDELCLERKWLGPCVNIFDAFRSDYPK